VHAVYPGAGRSWRLLAWLLLSRNDCSRSQTRQFVFQREPWRPRAVLSGVKVRASVCLSLAKGPTGVYLKYLFMEWSLCIRQGVCICVCVCVCIWQTHLSAYGPHAFTSMHFRMRECTVLSKKAYGGLKPQLATNPCHISRNDSLFSMLGCVDHFSSQAGSHMEH
jgi:hypothetical protein